MKTRSLASFLCGLLAAAGLAIQSASAATITTAAGGGADTFVSNDSQQSATSTQGAGTTAAVRNLAATRRKLMYVRFDLSSVTGPRTGGTLSFYFTGANRVRTMNVYGLADNATDDLWSEATTSYSTAPGILQPGSGGVAYNSGDASIDPAKLSLLGTFSTPGAANADLTTSTVTLNLDAFLAADTNNLVTFVLDVAASDSNASYFIATKENLSAAPVVPPRLTLPNAVPEPASVVGLASALALASLRSRKR
jgi:hypothetical protein